MPGGSCAECQRRKGRRGGDPGGGNNPCQRRDRRPVSAFYEFPASDRGCASDCAEARNPSGTSGLRPDPSYDALFGETGAAVPDLGVGPRRGRSASE